MVATKPKQKVISKRQLVKMIRRFGWAPFNSTRARSFKQWHGMTCESTLEEMARLIGSNSTLAKDINRAALAYCRKHGIK